jgi:hypothetical protein
MAIKPTRNTNYPYLNESDQNAMEDIASQDEDTDTRFKEEIAKCFDEFRREKIRIQSFYTNTIKTIHKIYKENILNAYKIYFECITIRQLPLSNPYRPSIAECKKQRDKLINAAEERNAQGKKSCETRTDEMEIENSKKLYSCIKKAQGPRGPSA